MLTLRKIENVPTGPNNRPKLAVKIVGGSTNRSVVYLAIDIVPPSVRRAGGLFNAECGEM